MSTCVGLPTVTTGSVISCALASVSKSCAHLAQAPAPCHSCGGNSSMMAPSFAHAADIALTSPLLNASTNCCPFAITSLRGDAAVCAREANGSPRIRTETSVAIRLGIGVLLGDGGRRSRRPVRGSSPCAACLRADDPGARQYREPVTGANAERGSARANKCGNSQTVPVFEFLRQRLCY